MAYLTYEEYSAYKATPMSEDEFNVCEPIAEEIINAYVFDAIERHNLMASEYYAEKIKRAVALEADVVKDTDGATSVERDIASHSVTVGETSESITYANDNQPVTMYVNGIKLAPLARTLLVKARALGRAVR